MVLFSNEIIPIVSRALNSRESEVLDTFMYSAQAFFGKRKGNRADIAGFANMLFIVN